MGPAKENLLDIKKLYKDALVADNVFQCTNSQKGCILVHGDDSPQDVELAFENNHLLGCSTMHGRQMKLGHGGGRSTIHVRRNTFDLASTSCEALRIVACENCDVFDNTFRHGKIVLSGEGSGGRLVNVEIRSNLLDHTLIVDYTNGTGYTCHDNTLRDVIMPRRNARCWS
jgi:hypothetical protein